MSQYAPVHNPVSKQRHAYSKSICLNFGGLSLGESPGRPRCLRIFRITVRWIINDTLVMRPLHFGHSRTSISKTRRINRCHSIRFLVQPLACSHPVHWGPPIYWRPPGPQIFLKYQKIGPNLAPQVIGRTPAFLIINILCF